MTSDVLRKTIETCRSLNVLYVEDDVEVRQQTLKLLKLCFSNVVVAKDGEEGLSIFKDNSIDLIFTDINMSRMNGLDMIRFIREEDLSVPIVVFSAYDYPDYLLKTIHYGVEGYLLKPFKLNDIVQILQKLLDQKRILPDYKPSCTHGLVLEEGFYWDKETNSLCKDGCEVYLSSNERRLFELLTTSKEQVYSSEVIEIAVFDDDFSDNKRVRNLLSRLRHKLEADVIQSIYGQGYKLRWSHT